MRYDLKKEGGTVCSRDLAQVSVVNLSWPERLGP